jgi:hypothetical protein
VSFYSIINSLYDLITDPTTGLNSFLSQRGLNPIRLFAKEKEFAPERDITPACIVYLISSSPGAESSAQRQFFLSTFQIQVCLREPVGQKGERNSVLLRYIDALVDFLRDKRVENEPLEFVDIATDYSDPSFTKGIINIRINHEGGET